jgi:hypothetical protein
VIAFKVQQDRKKKAEAAQKLAFADKFVTFDKIEVGGFWSCIMGGEIDVGMFSNTEQIQQRIESAYFTQQKTFVDHLTSECVPKIEHAIGSTGALSGAPSEYDAALAKYKSVLPKLQSGIEGYAEKIKSRGAVKDIDQLIQDTGSAFHSTVDPSPEGVAFEKFMNCAIPDLQKMKDVQEVLQFLADTCYKKDPVVFMTRVREECGSLITNVDKEAKAVPSKTFKQSMKKFFEEDARQLQAWDSCARKSRKGKKVIDLEEFLLASGDYMEARHDVVEAARAIQAAVSGEPAHKKTEAPAAAPTAPAPRKK